MSEVLTKRIIEVAPPFGDVEYYSYYYNGYIYINTSDKIYKFDTVNNTFTQLQLKSTPTTSPFSRTWGIGNKLYMFRYENIYSAGYKLIAHIDIYDIDSNTLTYDAYQQQNNNGSSSATPFLIGANTIVDNKINAWTSFYSGSVNIMFFTPSSPQTSIEPWSYPESNTKVPASVQHCGYFFATRQYNSSHSVISSNEFGTFTNRGKTIIGTCDGFRNNATLLKGNDIYIIGGRKNNALTTDITIFNTVTRTFSTIGLSLDNSFELKTIAGDGTHNYIFYGDKIIDLAFIDYNITYKISNKTGSEIYKELTGNAPITKIRFNYTVGSSLVGYVLTTLSGDITGSYTPNIPSGYKLVGYGSAPNTKIALAGLNMDVAVTIDENFTFYEIYQVYKPPATTFEMDLYQNTAENNRIDKTNYLTSVGSIFGSLRAECSIIRPSIIIEQETLPTFNYVYIGAFGRYYFVTGITSVAYRMWRIELNTDVLMTYKNGITLLTAIIARQENDYNDNLIDTEVLTEKEPTVTYQEIPNSVLTTQGSGSDHNFVITVVGA